MSDSGYLNKNSPSINERDKENKSKIRHERTKKEQFDLMIDFYKNNNEELMDRDSFQKLWDELAQKLNVIGPPYHTIFEWKRIWSEHKYNKKRKRVDIAAESDFNFYLNLFCSLNVYDFQTNQCPINIYK